MDNPNLHTFDKDLEIVDKGSQVFALTLSDHWSINGTPMVNLWLFPGRFQNTGK